MEGTSTRTTNISYDGNIQLTTQQINENNEEKKAEPINLLEIDSQQIDVKIKKDQERKKKIICGTFVGIGICVIITIIIIILSVVLTQKKGDKKSLELHQ